MKKTLLFGLLIFTTLSFFPTLAAAANMSNGNYILNKRDVEIQPFTNQPPPLPTPVEFQKLLGKGTNYTVETNKPDAFSFSLSSDLIDLGKLTATNPILRTLGINLKSHYGYQILTSEDHPLQKSTGTIPDTTCDNGSCSEITGATWTSILTYGFGYSLDEHDYLRFGNNFSHKGLATITVGLNPTVNRKLTYKVNVSATQAPGSYNNTVMYLATPDY
ncbi:MAG TPA: hypothetical protein VF810_04810 [Patescibacteria group bacterium]